MKKPQRRAQLALLAAAALGVTALLPGSAAAAKSNPGTQATIQVVASGLNVPRGLVYDKANNRLLIAEAGAASPVSADTVEAASRIRPGAIQWGS